ARKCSGDLLTSPPPAEKATARQDQAGQSSTDDWAGNGKILDANCCRAGLANPSDADIALAIEANDQFIAELERIHATARSMSSRLRSSSSFSWVMPLALFFAVPQLVYLVVWLVWRLLH